MTKPINTNQASEDELRYVLRHTKVTAYRGVPTDVLTKLEAEL